MTTDGFDRSAGDASTRALDSGRADTTLLYEAPRIIVLGSLADLTAGGSAEEPDGHGGAGGSGVI